MYVGHSARMYSKAALNMMTIYERAVFYHEQSAPWIALAF